MKRRFSLGVVLGISAGALFLSGCATTQTRISQHPEIYSSLSPHEQALVSRGQIAEGMSQSAVFLAWGNPDQRAEGRVMGRPSETWVYFAYNHGGYPYGSPYYYGHGYHIGLVSGHHGFGHGGGHHGFYDPFAHNPYFYPHGLMRTAYPYRTVSFRNGRVIAYQTLAAGGGPSGVSVGVGFGVSGHH